MMTKTTRILAPWLVGLLLAPLAPAVWPQAAPPASHAQGGAAAAGAGLGVAVHLAADLLSPARGYGRIWWPEPVQVSLE